MDTILPFRLKAGKKREKQYLPGHIITLCGRTDAGYTGGRNTLNENGDFMNGISHSMIHSLNHVQPLSRSVRYQLENNFYGKKYTKVHKFYIKHSIFYIF
jgi:hypothetical protein